MRFTGIRYLEYEETECLYDSRCAYKRADVLILCRSSLSPRLRPQFRFVTK